MISFSIKSSVFNDHRYIRSKWWLDDAQTYREIAQVQPEVINDIPVIKLNVSQAPQPQNIPVFVGHYTLNGIPTILSNKVVCVDYNAAKDKNCLVGYYWQGEEELTEHHFIYENKVTESCLKKTWCDSYTDFQDEDCFYDFAADGKLSDAMEKVKHATSTDNLPKSVDLLDEQINEILWQNWDPIGVNHMEDCRSEYDAYSWEITLVAMHNDTITIAAELYFLEKYYLDLITDDVLSRSQNVAIKIKECVEEIGCKPKELYGV